MKILFFLLVSFKILAQSACVYQGADVLCMKSNLKFQTSLNRIITGNPADPRVTAIAGIPGDLYIRLTTGQHYIKGDSGTTTNWNLIFTGSPGGGGDVFGPGSAVQDSPAFFSDSGGKLLKSGVMAFPNPSIACGNGTVLKSNGTNWTCGTDNSGGTGNVTGPATSAYSRPALFNDGTGKVLADSSNAYFAPNYTAFGDSTYGGNIILYGDTTAAKNPAISWEDLGGSSRSIKLALNIGMQNSYTLFWPLSPPIAGQILSVSDGLGQMDWIDAPSGSTATGDVVGPSSSNVGEIPYFADTSGKLISTSVAKHENLILNPLGSASASARIYLTNTGSQSVTQSPYVMPTFLCSNGLVLKSDGFEGFACSSDSTVGANDVQGPESANGATLGGPLAYFSSTTGKAINGHSFIHLRDSNPYAELLIGDNSTRAGYLHIFDSPTNQGLLSFYNGNNRLDLSLNNSQAVTYALKFPTVAPSAGQILQSDGSGQFSWITGGGGDIAGGSTSVDNAIPLYSGTLGKTLKYSAGITYSAGTLSLGGTTSASSQIAFNGLTSGQILLGRPDSSTNYTIKLPGVAPANSQILQSDASGNLSWINTPAGAGAVPNCSGSQRLTANGVNLLCVDNNFTNLGTIAAAGTATCSIVSNHICYYTATGNHTVAFSGTPVNGMVFQIIVTSAAAYTITWPTMKWPAGSAVIATKINAHSVFTIVYTPGGYLVTGVEDLK